MTSSLEKIFFNYILRNKKFVSIVFPTFFKNTEIRTIYNVVREYFTKYPEADIPSAKQIFEMVKMVDPDGLISKELFKSLVSLNLKDFDEQKFILPQLNNWILKNNIKNGTSEIVDLARELEEIVDPDNIFEIVNKIKETIDLASSTAFINDSDDMGSDFDNPESHLQDTSIFKVKSGFATIDHVLGGGWDCEGSLSILLGMTNQGKSLWMQNLSIGSADAGYNVLYISLEMSERKVMKRLGSMRLKIPVNEYDETSKNVEFIKKRIENLKKSTNTSGIGGDIFEERKIGKIFTKFWAAGTANVNDFDNFITKLKEKRGVKIDLIVVDYLTLVASTLAKGQGETLYTKGKNLAEGLRALSAKWRAPVVTGMQISKDAWSTDQIELQSVSESKAIVETADTIFAIIRTEEMKRQNMYRLKLLKQRDGDFLKSNMKFSLNPVYLTLENDSFLDG